MVILPIRFRRRRSERRTVRSERGTDDGGDEWGTRIVGLTPSHITSLRLPSCVRLSCPHLRRRRSVEGTRRDGRRRWMRWEGEGRTQWDKSRSPRETANRLDHLLSHSSHPFRRASGPPSGRNETSERKREREVSGRKVEHDEGSKYKSFIRLTALPMSYPYRSVSIPTPFTTPFRSEWNERRIRSGERETRRERRATCIPLPCRRSLRTVPSPSAPPPHSLRSGRLSTLASHSLRSWACGANGMRDVRRNVRREGEGP